MTRLSWRRPLDQGRARHLDIHLQVWLQRVTPCCLGRCSLKPTTPHLESVTCGWHSRTLPTAQLNQCLRRASHKLLFWTARGRWALLHCTIVVLHRPRCRWSSNLRRRWSPNQRCRWGRRQKWSRDRNLLGDHRRPVISHRRNTKYASLPPLPLFSLCALAPPPSPFLPLLHICTRPPYIPSSIMRLSRSQLTAVMQGLLKVPAASDRDTFELFLR